MNVDPGQAGPGTEGGHDTGRPGRCPWPSCPRRVPSSYLMCPRHWCRLPAGIRSRILATYRPGQTIASASPEYLDALRDALEFAVAAAGGAP
jgi:hypothetical protein